MANLLSLDPSNQRDDRAVAAPADIGSTPSAPSSALCVLNIPAQPYTQTSLGGYHHCDWQSHTIQLTGGAYPLDWP
jgi:hypothetical protein